MMIDEKVCTEKTGFFLRNGLEALSVEHTFEFEMVDMHELAGRLEEGDDSILTVLSELEFANFNGIKLKKNRIQRIAGRYAVKSALFKYKIRRHSIMDLSCIDVLKGQDSAPYILQYPEINCSITHSYPFCIGIVSVKNIGIDIEKTFTPDDSLIRYFYTDNEKEVLKKCETLEDYAKQSMIFWTRKEAVSKLLRLGMKMNFKELDTTRDLICIPKDNKQINLTSLSANGFCLSLAIEG